MTTRRNSLNHSLLATGVVVAWPGSLSAPEKPQKEILKCRLPYKNSDLKGPLATEDEYPLFCPKTLVPRNFAGARPILPSPVWEGHSDLVTNKHLIKNER